MKKSKQPKLKKVDELEEEVPVERLKVNTHGAGGDEALVVDDIDSLLREERLAVDDSLDVLFIEEKKNKYDDVEVEVRKALYQVESSKAHLLRANKSADVTKETRDQEISKYKTIEDEWDGVLNEEEVKAGKPLIYVAFGVLAVIVSAGAWALWSVSRNDQVAHKDVLDQRQQEKEYIENLKKDASQEIRKIESLLLEFSELEKADDKLKYFHDSDHFKEQILAYYQQPENIKPYINLEVKRVVEELVGREKVWTAIARYGYRNFRVHKFFFFHKESDGNYTLDWKATAGIQDFDWKTFVDKQSTIPIEVRVTVQPKIKDGHYNWGFNDEDYSAYRLKLNEQQIFWGYIRNDNADLVEEMNNVVIMMRGYQKVYRPINLEMILKIRFLEGTHELNKQCVEIIEIVSTHWLDIREKEGKGDEGKPIENP